MMKKVYGMGLWLIDYIKEVDAFPIRNELSFIHNEFQSGGGGVFNVLMDLAMLQNDIELYALGRWGSDERGVFLESELHSRNIDTTMVDRMKDYNTSYTLVLSEKRNNIRSFLFHNTGVDDNYSMNDFNQLLQLDLTGTIFYLGYINFVNSFYNEDKDFRVFCGRLLSEVKKKGGIIVADCVSVSDDERPLDVLLDIAFPYLDVLIMNEVELGIYYKEKYSDKDALDKNRIEQLIRNLSSKYTGTLIVHFPGGAYISSSTQDLLFVPSFRINENEIKGTVGAGDAFCAGIINALLDQKDWYSVVQEGHAMSCFNLLSETSICTGVGITQIQDFIKKNKVNKN